MRVETINGRKPDKQKKIKNKNKNNETTLGLK
jgi:hypothetical protein